MMTAFSELPAPERACARSKSGKPSPPMLKAPTFRKLRRETPSQKLDSIPVSTVNISQYLPNSGFEQKNNT